MVAGFAEVADRKDFLVAGACNHPNCLVLPLGVEESHRGKIYRDGGRSVLPLGEQFRLIFANVFWAQTVGGTMEAS